MRRRPESGCLRGVKWGNCGLPGGRAACLSLNVPIAVLECVSRQAIALFRKHIHHLPSPCARLFAFPRDRKGWPVLFGGVRGLRPIVLMWPASGMRIEGLVQLNYLDFSNF
ncbi:hypothetical protein BK187_13495 [Brucella melitensis]|nr:hypothetical protein BK187_13495 [Brucella melitensis]EEZ09970.1 predicted protein [Brucella melitensis bv. 3 str. Ether]ARY29330.1 hypothetical protein BK219_13495 [Brucella melitensis]ARY38806.1 hypothetical protein BK217_13495 [Brucella melitensis]HAQ31946.1 hypothetical protein [Brucella melitensis]